VTKKSAIDTLFLDMDLNGHHFSADIKQIAEILHNRSVFDFSIKKVRLFSRNMLWTSRKWHLSEMLSLIEESILSENMRCPRGGLYLVVLNLVLDQLLHLLYRGSRISSIFFHNLYKVVAIVDNLVDVGQLVTILISKASYTVSLVGRREYRFI
jgi:hypothetical protein